MFVDFVLAVLLFYRVVSTALGSSAYFFPCDIRLTANDCYNLALANSVLKMQLRKITTEAVNWIRTVNMDGIAVNMPV